MDNIISKLKGIFKKNTVQSTQPINPHKHWMMILWIFLAASIILIIFSLFLLFQIKNEQIFQANPVIKEDNSLIKENLLKSINDYFDTKEKKEGDLIANPVNIKDPSL